MQIRGLSLSSLFLVVVSSLTMSVSGLSKDIGESINQYLSVRTEIGRFSGVALVAKGDTIILRKGYGFADVEKRLPYTPETPHEVASISKMFTAMAALRLRDQGKLKLEDPICKYLNDCPEAWKPITVQHLMRHTSGISDYEEKLELGSDKYLELMTQPNASTMIFENSKKLPLDFKPGEKFNYSNTGYIVLSYVVQKAADVPFADFVVKNLLKPAGMMHSGVLGTSAPPTNLANGYTFGAIGWEKTLAGYPLTAGHLKKVPQLALTPPAGDAWLYSTVDDLHRWSQVMDGGGFIPTSEVSEVFTAGRGNYGYGWFIDNGFNRKRMRHNGELPGYSSEFSRFPDDKLTIIIFSNLDRAPLNRITRDITAIVLGMPYDMPVRGKVIELTAQQIAQLVGAYQMGGGIVLTIRKEPEFLMAEIKGRYTAGLIPLSPTEFYFPLADGKAIFTLDESGKALKVNMHYGGEDHIAERVAQSP